ncbi:Uncharacterised protein [Vibrio cholerae]|nr:Uncharacterised protein [Vibrio cholerae]CSI85381.1 Uncharacterised protein [Vibrio cholerae]
MILVFLSEENFRDAIGWGVIDIKDAIGKTRVFMEVAQDLIFFIEHPFVITVQMHEQLLIVFNDIDDGLHQILRYVFAVHQLVILVMHSRTV